MRLARLVQPFSHWSRASETKANWLHGSNDGLITDTSWHSRIEQPDLLGRWTLCSFQGLQDNWLYEGLSIHFGQNNANDAMVELDC